MRLNRLEFASLNLAALGLIFIYYSRPSGNRCYETAEGIFLTLEISQVSTKANTSLWEKFEQSHIKKDHSVTRAAVPLQEHLFEKSV